MLVGDWADFGMVAALTLAQAVRRRTCFGFNQTREPLGGVEIEEFFGYNSFQTQKILNAFHFEPKRKAKISRDFDELCS